MSGFDAIDSLLAAVAPTPELPDARVRRQLREQAGLSKAQVARALGVSPSTVTGWEAGRDPSGDTRTRYAYLLDGLAAKLAPTKPGPEPETQAPATAPDADASTPAASAEDGQDSDDVETLPAPEPCVLCGARRRSAWPASRSTWTRPTARQASPPHRPSPHPNRSHSRARPRPLSSSTGPALRRAHPARRPRAGPSNLHANPSTSSASRSRTPSPRTPATSRPPRPRW